MIDYDNFWEDHSLVDEGPSARHRRRLIKRMIPQDIFFGKVLDVGCGSGVLLRELAVLGYVNDLWGVDVSKNAIEQTDYRLRNCKKDRNITLMVGNIEEESTLPKEKFDLVVCSEVLEHITDDMKAIENLKRLLKTGGYLIITVPHRMDKWTQQDTVAEHIRRYEWREILSKLVNSQFIILEAFTWGYPIYSLYHHLILRRVNPKITRTKPTPLKRIISSILYRLFFINDTFRGNSKGEMLFIIAKKDELN